MIEAIIHYQDSTLIMDLPRNIYDIHEKLMSIGCPTAPGRIPLTDNEDDALRVKLYGRIEMGNHLIRILSEQNTLADANALASVVLNASDDIKLKLGEKIVKDQYDSIPEIVTDIRQMTYDAGPIKRTFYCPLVGNIEDGYDDTFTVGSSFLRDYAWAIEDAIEKDRRLDDQDMAQYFHEDAGLKDKLASMVWGVEVYRGELFGKIECSLKEEMTPAEEEILKDYITGQNSDGWGEHFEQQPNADIADIQARDSTDSCGCVLPGIFLFCGSAKLLRNPDRLLHQACEEEKVRVEYGGNLRRRGHQRYESQKSP